MKPAVGIIAEYNPFHNGHAHHLSRAKALSGCPYAIVVMSGSFVQRGEPAAFDKFQRARWALHHGADLVLELPSSFACAGAERFAAGGVAALAATGLVSALAFGTEHADLALLSSLAFYGETPAFSERVSFHLKRGLSFPAARAEAYAEAFPQPGEAEAFAAPNNILAFEYLKALRALAPDITPTPVARTGAAHDAPGINTEVGFASASALREAIRLGDLRSVRSAVPEDVAAEIESAVSEQRAPKGAERLSDAILYALRKCSRAELAALPDVGEGLENVLYEKARAAVDYPAFLAAVKTRRYTLARLRRISMHALLGVDKAFLARHPAPLYLRVLGVRRDALALLSALSERASLPVVTGHEGYAALDAAAKEQFALDLFAGELLAMASPAPEPAKNEFLRPLLIV